MNESSNSLYKIRVIQGWGAVLDRLLSVVCHYLLSILFHHQHRGEENGIQRNFGLFLVSNRKYLLSVHSTFFLTKTILDNRELCLLYQYCFTSLNRSRSSDLCISSTMSTSLSFTVVTSHLLIPIILFLQVFYSLLSSVLWCLHTVSCSAWLSQYLLNFLVMFDVTKCTISTFTAMFIHIFPFVRIVYSISPDSRFIVCNWVSI